MPEHIYASTNEGDLEAIQETPFAQEEDLQKLIAQHPELLDGEQITPGNARRWILITREKGIAELSGQAARWSVDHLIVDQDAMPTLAELKRGSNPEIRRTIVGQLLEYAAHASDTWTADELREAFERRTEAQGLNSRDEIAKLLQSDGDPPVDEFWKRVSTNLSANRLRLLFVADDIPDPLARVVGFLNEQMENIEVLAVEIKRFRGQSGQTLVPRVIGRRVAGTGRARSGQRLTRESFLESFDDAGVRAVAERLLDVAQQSGADIAYGDSFGLSIRARCPAWRSPISVAWLYSQPGKGWYRTRDFSFGAAILDYELHEDLQKVLQDWVKTISSEPFVADASSKGVQASAVAYDAAIEHGDVLVQRLGAILAKLASM